MAKNNNEESFLGSLRKVGRPRAIEDPKEFDQGVDEYVKYCVDNNFPVTITGMALYLGFCSRQSLYDYEKDPKFSYSIKRAKGVVEAFAEAGVHGNNAAGPIFLLKNFGWKDTQHNVNQTIEVEIPEDD